MIELDSRGAAELISSLFNAPVIAAPIFLALLISENPKDFFLYLAISLTFGTIAPLAALYSLSKEGVIPDLYASDRKTRVIPFLVVLVLYSLGAVGLAVARAPAIITALMLCYLGNSVIMMLITLKWKISIHMAGVTGPATALIYWLGVIAVPFLLIAIPVGWARVRLRAHNVAQVTAGAVLTVITTWLQVSIYLRLL